MARDLQTTSLAKGLRREALLVSAPDDEDDQRDDSEHDQDGDKLGVCHAPTLPSLSGTETRAFNAAPIRCPAYPFGMSNWSDTSGNRPDHGAAINAAVNARENVIPASAPSRPLEQGNRIETMPLVNEEM